MFVRPSKFRHVFGCPFKKEFCYEGLKATKSAHDTNFCAANPLFLAVVVESSGGGSFVVLSIEKTGRIDINTPKVCGHKAPITDIKWCPHNDHVIASSSDDCTIKVWSIPDEGLFHNLTEPLVDLADAHYKRVSYIEWHPCVKDILLSAGADHKCIIWDVREGTILKHIESHQDMIFSISWNFDGSLFVTTCKDKMIRVIDPRSGNVVAEGMGHQGNKASKVVFLNGSQIFTTGFSRTSERQFALWDHLNLSKPIKMEDLDSSCGTIIPFFDPDLNIVYLAGKGDGNIRYVEIIYLPPSVYFLNQFHSSIPQRGLGMMPKRGLDMKKCEIARFYKLHSTKDICEPISMIVPRKSDNFQPDIYPPTSSTEPSITLEEWMSGVNKPPILLQLENGSRDSSTQIKRRTTTTVELPHADDNYQRVQSETGPLKSPGRSKSLHRDNNVTRNNTVTPAITMTGDECYNSVTDLASINSSSKKLSVVMRRKRRTRTDHVLDDEPRSSPSSYDDDEHDARKVEVILRPKATFPTCRSEADTNSLCHPIHHDSFQQPEESVIDKDPIKEIDKDAEIVSTSDGFKVQNVLLIDTICSSSIDISEITEENSEKHGSRAKLDCISVDAPDDGVILPSKLRASMNTRHRKVERGGTSSFSFARKGDKPPNSELQGLIRVGSVREKSRNFNSIMDRNPVHRKSEVQDKGPQTIEPHSDSELKKNTSKDSTDNICQQSINPEPSKSNVHDSSTKIRECVSNVQQLTKPSLAKSCSSDQVPNTNQPIKTVTARILPMSNISQAKKFPGKSLSDCKTNEVQKSKSYKNQNGGRSERKIDKRQVEGPTEEMEFKKQYQNNNNYIKNNENMKSSKSDISMSHTELLQELMRQQQEIKKLKHLLEQKDAKLRKMEEELHLYKYRNRRMI